MGMSPQSNDEKIFHFDLSIRADQFQRLYRGTARTVLVRTEGGVTVQFPATNLMKFVAHDGVHGRFRLVIDKTNRLKSLERAR